MTKQRLAHVLTYAGAMPFLAAPILSVIDTDVFSLDIKHAALTYSAIIASFISGIHWGLYLFKDTSLNLFIHSNIVTLMAWIAVVIYAPASTGILIFCFLYLLAIDYKLVKEEIIEPWYMRMRFIISIIVILALASLFFLGPVNTN